MARTAQLPLNRRRLPSQIPITEDGDARRVQRREEESAHTTRLPSRSLVTTTAHRNVPTVGNKKVVVTNMYACTLTIPLGTPPRHRHERLFNKDTQHHKPCVYADSVDALAMCCRTCHRGSARWVCSDRLPLPPPSSPPPTSGLSKSVLPLVVVWCGVPC